MKVDATGVVEVAMQPIVCLNVPLALKASIERQSESLLGLATNLLQAGMNDHEVRSVIDRACASYRDELISAILALRNNSDA